MTGTVSVKVTVNDRAETLTGGNTTVLADALREQLNLRGTKISCDQGACGACTVLVDGRPTASCMTFLFTLAGSQIRTIEGLDRNGQMTAVQKAFAEETAFQCGFCTPGMIMMLTALFETTPDPDPETVQRWLASNICRCTGYASILRAVENVRKRLQAAPRVRK